MQVSVRDNNVDQALKALKKKLQREGLLPMKPKPVFGAGPGGEGLGDVATEADPAVGDDGDALGVGGAAGWADA